MATVEKGFVTAVGEGVAVITATAADGSGVNATCQVIVNKGSKQYEEGYYEYIDLGLSVKWATMNVGASSPEDYGDYFAWGEIAPKHTYTWDTYKYCNGNGTTMTKYCTESSYGTVDNQTTLEMSDEAARQSWGGSWRMPTNEEMAELCTECTWTWTIQNGVMGYKVISKTNGNFIFLPAAGNRNDNSLISVGTYGCYWSSSLDTSSPNCSWYLLFSSDYWGSMFNFGRRYSGQSIRPVCP